jgi:hypothetical protein
MLPSTAPGATISGALSAAQQPPPPVQSATLFIGGADAKTVQPNGDIVAVGKAAMVPLSASTSTTMGNGAAGVLALTRVTPDGRLDSTFGNGGEVWTSITANTGEVCSLSIVGDGKIKLTVVLAGNMGVIVASFDADGKPDNTFAADAVGSLFGRSSADVALYCEAVASAVVISLDGNSLCGQSEGVTVTLDYGTSVSVSNVPAVTGTITQANGSQSSVSFIPAVVGPANTQINWTGGSGPGPLGGPLLIGRPSGFLPISTAPIHTSNSHPTAASPAITVLAQIPWSRANDSLLSWNESTPSAEPPAVLVTVVSFEGGDLQMPGSESSPVYQLVAVQGTARLSAAMPSYMYDSLIVPTNTLAAPLPADDSPPHRPAMTANAEGLPAYLIQGEAAALAYTRQAAEPVTANESRDAGLAAVDAAFALTGRGERPATDLTTRALPPDSTELNPPQRRGVCLPLFFVLLVAASGGGAALQGAVQYLPSRRSTNLE